MKAKNALSANGGQGAKTGPGKAEREKNKANMAQKWGICAEKRGKIGLWSSQTLD